MVLAHNNSQLQGEISKLGLVEIVGQFGQMQRIFNDKQMAADSSVLRCRHFMHLLSEMLSEIKVVNLTNFYELLEEENKKKLNEPFWIEIQEGELCQILSEEFKGTIKIY